MGVAGVLMQEFPNAVLVVHLHGASHIVDQAKLTVETVDVYGEENTRKHYGTIILVPEGRVLNEEDESLIDFHGCSLLFVDAPSHASLH